MKVIGIVGGIGPESTIDYYRLLLARFRETAGAGTPGILINSIDLTRLLALADAGDRAGLTGYLLEAIESLARAGADVGLFAANTPHLVFDEVQRRAPIRLVSLVAAACEAAQRQGLTRVGLLGTRFTMQGRFYPDLFASRGIAVVAPRAADQAFVHGKYVTELVAGRFTAGTRAGFLAVIDRMREHDAIDGVILGGTELPLLLREVSHPLPFLDTTRIHVEAVFACVMEEITPMSDSFQFVALPSERFSPLFSRSDAELQAMGARRMIVDGKPGFPCRVSLADAEVGETVILLPFTHHDVASPYRASGPIFVRRGATTAHPAVGEIPVMFRHRLLSVRAYDAAAMLVGAEVVEGTELEAAIRRLFTNDGVSYLHIHNALPGCYDCRVVRAGQPPAAARTAANGGRHEA